MSRKKKKNQVLRAAQFWLLQNVLCHLLGMFLWVYRATLRIESSGDAEAIRLMKEGCPAIYAYWHENMVLSLFCSPMVRRHARVTVMLSPSDDAEVLARTIRWFRLDSVRGSSFKQPRAVLKQIIREVRGGVSCSLAVDGSRGPRRKLQPGGLMIAQAADAPLIPCSWECASLWRARSWDRTKLPKPFSRIRLTLHPPVQLSAESSKAEREASAIQLEELLRRHETLD